jgi:hypothetical protein
VETFAPAPPPRPRYRIEHRTAGGLEVLSRHPDDLDDLAAYLAAEGAGGVLVVVEEATGRDIVRREIPERPRPAGG